MNEEILNKLRKMLTLHKGASGAESDAALEKATALAAKHNIDLAIAAIDEAPTKKEEFIQGEFIEKRRKCVAQRFITDILQNHFNVRVLYQGSRYYGQKILFLGRKSDVEFAIYVQGFLKSHIMDSWDNYKTAHNAPTSHRATFFSGFYRGLNVKLTEAKRKQEEESFNGLAPEIKVNAENRYALIIKSEEIERENFVTTKYPKIRNASSARLNYYGGDTAHAGFKHGYATNIARPLMGQLCLN